MRGIFTLCGYSGNFINLLLKVCVRDWNEVLQGCSLGDYQIPSAHVDALKNMAANKRDIFVLYGYSANLLLRICLRVFNEILQGYLKNSSS